MALNDNTVEILRGEMKERHTEEKVIARIAACPEVIDDSLRFLTPPTTTQRPSMPGFSRSCRFVYFGKTRVLVAVAHELCGSMMSARSNRAYCGGQVLRYGCEEISLTRAKVKTPTENKLVVANRNLLARSDTFL